MLALGTGATLNLAARVAAHAQAGQILCTEPVASVAGQLDHVACREIGPVRFKNVVDPVRVFEIIAPHLGGDAAIIDPVCRMRLVPATAPARLPFEGATVFFCSFACARAFAARPTTYRPTREPED